MNLALKLILIAQLTTTTAYRSIPSQTDNNPFITSTGEHVHKYGVAVSEDLLCPLSFGSTKHHKAARCDHKEKLHYGDWLYVEGYGLRVVNDCMAPRHKNHIDLWVRTYKEEKAVGIRRLKVYKVEDVSEIHI